MTRLDERELARALHESVPEPPPSADRPERVRRVAGLIRLRRRAGAALGAAAVALAIGLPLGLARLPGPTAPTAPGPAGARSPSGLTSIASCPGRVCHPGRVIAAIEHPLNLPSTGPGGACPVSPVRRFPGGAGFSGSFAAIGLGPLYIGGAVNRSPVVRLSAGHGGWQEQKVIWVVAAHYSGPLLLRGARVDGPGPLRFAHYLGAAGAPGYGRSGHGFRQLLYVRDGLHSSAQHVLESIPSDIYVRAPGCYAIQVDGEGFSEALVFRAIR